MIEIMGFVFKIQTAIAFLTIMWIMISYCSDKMQGQWKIVAKMIKTFK